MTAHLLYTAITIACFIGMLTHFCAVFSATNIVFYGSTRGREVLLSASCQHIQCQVPVTECLGVGLVNVLLLEADLLVALQLLEVSLGLSGKPVV